MSVPSNLIREIIRSKQIVSQTLDNVALVGFVAMIVTSLIGEYTLVVHEWLFGRTAVVLQDARMRVFVG